MTVTGNLNSQHSLSLNNGKAWLNKKGCQAKSSRFPEWQ